MNWYILGQIFGFVAVILGFISFQMKTSKNLLVMQTFTSLVFSLHYLLIGAFPASVLNAVGIVRNIVYNRKNKNSVIEITAPWVFAVIMVVLGLWSWQGIHSTLVILGIGINTVCLSLKNPQNIRKSILVSSPLVLMYDIFELSIGGIIYETVVIASSVIGILRLKNKSEKQ